MILYYFITAKNKMFVFFVYSKAFPDKTNCVRTITKIFFPFQPYIKPPTKSPQLGFKGKLHWIVNTRLWGLPAHVRTIELSRFRICWEFTEIFEYEANFPMRSGKSSSLFKFNSNFELLCEMCWASLHLFNNPESEVHLVAFIYKHSDCLLNRSRFVPHKQFANSKILNTLMWKRQRSEYWKIPPRGWKNISQQHLGEK